MKAAPKEAADSAEGTVMPSLGTEIGPPVPKAKAKPKVVAAPKSKMQEAVLQEEILEKCVADGPPSRARDQGSLEAALDDRWGGARRNFWGSSGGYSGRKE